jgi:NADH dehydrogenase
MKVLVTGGTGFVGTALRNELKQQGHEVRLLVRPQSVGKIDPRDGFEIIAGDVLDTHACLRAVKDIDALVHLVGIRREYPEDGITYEAMHTEAAYAIFDAARRTNVARGVYLSALGAREDAQAGYHRTKFEAEEILKKSGMRWTIFRPSILFGHGDEFPPLMADLVHRPVVPVIDGGKTLLQPVSLENVVGPLARTVTMPETQGKTYQIGGPERVKFVEIMDRVARVYEVWPNAMNISSFFARPMVKFMQRFRSFPLTLEELYLLLEDNVCDPAEFTAAFGVTLDTYLDKIESLCPKREELVA